MVDVEKSMHLKWAIEYHTHFMMRTLRHHVEQKKGSIVNMVPVSGVLLSRGPRIRERPLMRMCFI